MRVNTTDGRIGSVASRCIIGRPYCLDVTHRRLAEEAFVFAGKLSEAFIANFESGCCGVETLY